MNTKKPAAIVTSLHDPKPLCCQHCFASDSLVPLGAEVSPITGDMAIHWDLIHTAESHEMPREWPVGMLLVGFDLSCRREDCGRITHLVLTAGANGTFLQLVPLDDAEPDDEQSTE